MEKQVQFFIYGLYDPRTSELRYIGRSSTGLRRAKFHSFPSALTRDGNLHKVNWIRLVQSLGLQPRIEVLEKCASVDALPEAERRHIAANKSSGRLLNATDGGEGAEGHKQSPETIAKRVAKLKGRKNSSETLKRMSEAAFLRGGVPHTEEAKKKISTALSGRTFSEAHRSSLSISATVRWAR